MFCSTDTTLVVNPFDANESNQRWRVDGDAIRKRDEHDKGLDLTGDESESGSRVCLWEIHGGEHQKWRIDYV